MIIKQPYTEDSFEMSSETGNILVTGLRHGAGLEVSMDAMRDDAWRECLSARCDYESMRKGNEPGKGGTGP